MEYCFLKGFLVFFLIQRCTSEGLSSAIQSSTAVTLQDGQALPMEPELPPAEVAPVVAPPSLKEVQQAVQEAAEQVEGRGAEEVLKELLERVVEAALGQVEGGGEAKADEAAVQETVEDALGAEEGETETDTEAEVLEQAAEGEGEGEDVVAVEEQEVEVVDTFENVAVEGNGDVEEEGETATGSVVETKAGVETGGREAGREEVLDESVDPEISQGIVEEGTVEETGGYAAVEEAGVEDSEEQVALFAEKGAFETEMKEVEETPTVVEVAVGGEPEQETTVESDPSLVVDEEEQIEDAWGNEGTQVNDMEGEVIVQHSDNYEIETTQVVVGEPVEEVEEVNIVKDAEEPEAEDEQGRLSVEGGAAEEVEAEATEVGEAEEGRRYGEGVIKGESVANEGGDQQAGEEEQFALETSHDSEKEDQEVLVISAPGPEDGAEVSMEQSPESQPPTPSSSLGGVELGENTLRDEKSDSGNEIIAPTDDLLPHDPIAAQPTLDHFVKDVLAEPPETGEEPGEANELVEDTADNKETSELGLEAWKIGAISAAAFLVLETVIITIYILKCRNKNSTTALQRACEEGCVEPEATTGGDCSDDTLPAGNGDAQQIAALDPSDVASTLVQNKEQHEEEHAITMSNLPPSSAEESANPGPGPDSSQDLRTSIL